MEGRRPLLAEVRAPLDTSSTAQPRRATSGLTAPAWPCCWPRAAAPGGPRPRLPGPPRLHRGRGAPHGARHHLAACTARPPRPRTARCPSASCASGRSGLAGRCGRCPRSTDASRRSRASGSPARRGAGLPHRPGRSRGVLGARSDHGGAGPSRGSGAPGLRRRAGCPGVPRAGASPAPHAASAPVPARVPPRVPAPTLE
ncbi:hypothetical protein QJS66_09905 [Kocuria rhizophila]|nr:hypothetical protein QJS66_09905 [Kocuria rhizophila]